MAQDRSEFEELAVDGFIVIACDGFGDLVAEVAAEAIPEAVDGLAGPAFVEMEGFAERPVATFIGAEPEKWHQCGEVMGAARGVEIEFQASEREAKNLQRPLAVKDFLGGDFRRNGAEAGLGRLGIERDDLPTAALFASRVPVMVGDPALEHAEEEGSEFSAAGIGFLKESDAVFQQVVEEPLGQVLGVLDGEAAAASEGVEGGPIEAAEFFQCAVFVASRRHHETPTGLRKGGVGFLGEHQTASLDVMILA